MIKMSNQVSLASYLVLFTLTLGSVTFAQALKCYKCDGKDCSTAPGEIEECGGEKPVCSQYIDLTGKQTGGKLGTVFKRYCGEGSLAGTTEVCMCLTPDWDECLCNKELCNGHLPRCGIRNFGTSGEDGGCRK